MTDLPAALYSDAELAYAQEYADYLAVGAPYPEHGAHLDPERTAMIRRELERIWRDKVRTITRRRDTWGNEALQHVELG